MLIQDLRSRIYYVTPEQQSPNGDLRDRVQGALSAGAGMVQYRPKHLTTREMVEEGTHLVRMARAARTPLIINDRVDLALAVGADGVHLGSEDMPVAHARRLLGPSAIIGATVADASDARIAEQDGATYALVGPFYGPEDQPGSLSLDLERIQIVRDTTMLPVCVHGRIDVEALKSLSSRGVQMVCVCEEDGPGAESGNSVAEAAALVKAHLLPEHVAP